MGIILEVFWVYFFDVFLVVALLFFNGLGLVFLWVFYFPLFFSRFFCELKLFGGLEEVQGVMSSSA